MPKNIPNVTPDGHGLGRRVALDPRDYGFPLRAMVPAHRTQKQRSKLDEATAAAVARGWRNWSSSKPLLNQGAQPHCVGFAWAHWLAAGPVVQKEKPTARDGTAIYRLAQKLDEWEGEDYAGTSVRGGAKALVQLGYVKEYRWAFEIEDVIDALLTVGPVVTGTVWLGGMELEEGLSERNAVMQFRGEDLGGHAYMIVGVNVPERRFRVKNSWGPKWAANGRAWFPFADYERALKEYGEACLATEIQYADPAAVG